MLEYIKRNDFDVQNANASLFAADLVFDSYVNSKIAHGLDYPPVLSHFSYKREDYFYFYQIINLKSLENIGASIYRDYLRRAETLKGKVKKHKKLEYKMDAIWVKYQRDNDLPKFFEDLIKTARMWWYLAAIGEDKGEVINREAVPAFAKRNNISVNRAGEIITCLAHSNKQAVFNSERRDFLEICLDIISKTNTDKKITAYLKKYFWADTDFYSRKVLTKEVLLSKASAESSSRTNAEIQEEISHIDSNFSEIGKKKKKLEKEVKLSKDDKKDILFSKLIIEWFDERKLGMMKHMYYLFSALSDISDRYNIKYSDLSCYTVDEVDNLLSQGIKVNAKELEGRYQDVFVVFEKGEKMQRFYGKDAEELLEAIKAKHENIEFIKGSVASIGQDRKVKGMVSVVLDPLTEKFIDGSILVTSMTRVEFVPLMRRAKAIITDEGGVACHAAIVSRELGIPCIIGTKVATKRLKSGDAVEINFDDGTVKVLK